MNVRPGSTDALVETVQVMGEKWFLYIANLNGGGKVVDEKREFDAALASLAAVVDEQRAENTRLMEAMRRIAGADRGTFLHLSSIPEYARNVLRPSALSRSVPAGDPAAPSDSQETRT